LEKAEKAVDHIRTDCLKFTFLVVGTDVLEKSTFSVILTSFKFHSILRLHEDVRPRTRRNIFVWTLFRTKSKCLTINVTLKMSHALAPN
jgi:hypothetical protein